jgi:hypothetical protein
MDILKRFQDLVQDEPPMRIMQDFSLDHFM